MKIFHKRRHHGNAFGYHTKRRTACDVSRVSLLKNIKEQNTPTRFCKIRYTGEGLNDDNAIIGYPELVSGSLQSVTRFSARFPKRPRGQSEQSSAETGAGTGS